MNLRTLSKSFSYCNDKFLSISK